MDLLEEFLQIKIPFFVMFDWRYEMKRFHLRKTKWKGAKSQRHIGYIWKLNFVTLSIALIPVMRNKKAVPRFGMSHLIRKLFPFDKMENKYELKD